MQIIPLASKPINLTNNGELALYFIGTGSAFSKHYAQTNIIIVKGNTHLVIDFGSLAPTVLHNKKFPIVNLRNFYITHSHADHIGGLEEVMMMNRYCADSKPNILITKQYQKLLWENSLKGGSAFSELLSTPSEAIGFKSWAHGSNTPSLDARDLKLIDFWNPIYLKKLSQFKRETWEIQFEGLDLKMPRTCHIPSNANHWQDASWSTGVIIDDKIFFSADTKYDPELIYEYEKKYNFEILFHDCQLFDGGVHASLNELNQLPPEIKKKMILMHYGDSVTDYLDKIKEYGFHSIAKSDQWYTF